MKRILALLLAASALTFLPSEAADALQPPDLDRYVRWGPLRVRPGFGIPVFGYDDNVFALGAAGTSPGDLIVQLSARIEGVVLFGPSAFLTFKEQLDYLAYQTFHDLNYKENLGTARLVFPLQRVGFFLDAVSSEHKDPPASEVLARPVRREERLGAGTILRLGWRTEAELGLVRSVWTNTAPGYVSAEGFTTAQLLNRTETGTQAKLTYRITGTTRITLDTTHRRIVFEEPAVHRDSLETVLLPGIEFGEGGKLFGSARLGWSKLEPTQSGDPPLSGAVGDANLVWRMSGLTSLRLDALRKDGFAIYESNRYFKQTGFELHGVRYFNRVFGVELGGGRGHFWFPAASEGGDRTDLTWKVDAALKLRLPESLIGRRTEYSIGIVHRRRVSTVPLLSYSGNVFGISANVGF